MQQRAGALVLASDVFLSTRHDQLIALAGRHAMLTIYFRPNAVPAGGLLSYGIDLAASYRQVGGYVGRIFLKGAKPVDLPVLQPTKFLLAINLRTAKDAQPRCSYGAARARRRGDRMIRRPLPPDPYRHQELAIALRSLSWHASVQAWRHSPSTKRISSLARPNGTWRSCRSFRARRLNLAGSMSGPVTIWSSSPNPLLPHVPGCGAGDH